MATAKFYLGNFQEYFKDKETSSPTKFYKIILQEGSGYDGDYTDIDTIYPVPGQDYFESAVVASNFIEKWYRFIFYGKDSQGDDFKLGTSEPVIPESVGTIIDDIRLLMGDTNLDDPCWSDQEYLKHIRFALKQYKGDKNFSTIREEDVVPIQLLVRIELALIIAYDYSKYYALQAPSATLDKSMIATHYLEMARSLESHYDSIARRLGISTGGKNNDGIIHEMPAPNVGNAKRYSVTAGIHVDNIEPVMYPRRNLLFGRDM